MKTVHIAGLGMVSRAKAAQIAVCDEAGATDNFNPIPVVRALRPAGYTDKEVRQAIFTLTRRGVLTKVSAGQYSWA